MVWPSFSIIFQDIHLTEGDPPCIGSDDPCYLLSFAAPELCAVWERLIPLLFSGTGSTRTCLGKAFTCEGVRKQFTLTKSQSTRELSEVTWFENQWISSVGIYLAEPGRLQCRQARLWQHTDILATRCARCVWMLHRPARRGWEPWLEGSGWWLPCQRYWY